jgi:hypothetical protein
MPKNMYKGSMFPKPSPEPPAPEASTEADLEAIETPRNRPSLVSIDVSLETDEFIKYLNSSLRLRNPPPLTELDGQPAENRTRDTSSSYGSEGNDLARVQSPASPPPSHTLRESNLSKYSNSCHYISDLKSPSNSSGDSGGDSTKVAVDEAAIVIKEWQTEMRPEKPESDSRRILLDSQELTPSDSASQIYHKPPTPTFTRPPKPHWFRRLTGGDRPSFDSSAPGFKDQFDGGGDYHFAPSPNSSIPPSTAVPPGGAGKKRKFSIRTLSVEIPKKANKKLKIMANSVYRQSARHLGHAKQKWKQKSQREKKRFEAWRANMGKGRPTDALDGKPETLFGLLNPPPSRQGHKDWWQDGARRYRAPSWMIFGGSHKKRASKQ